VIDAKGEARIRLKNMKQGKRSVTEYWNEFRLVASEGESEDSTGGELLLGGMITELQNAWRSSSEEYKDLQALAQWAIRKETKLASVRHIQGSPSTKNIQRETTTPRKPRWDIQARQEWQSELLRSYGTGGDAKKTKIQYLKGRIPKKDTRTTMPQVCTTRTLGQELHKKSWTQTI